MSMPRVLASASVASAFAVCATPAAAQTSAELSTGTEYREGDYGTGQRIKTMSVENQAQLQAGRVTFSASLPYLRVDAPGNVVAGGGGLLGLPILIDPSRPAARVRREGLGDLRLGASYALPRLAGFDLALSGQAKLPTASAARGLGTGRTDYAVGAEISHGIGRVTPFVGIGYTMPGDPAGYNLGNSLSGRAGIAARLAGNVRGAIAYGYAQSASPLVPDEQEISTSLNVGLSRGLSLGVRGGAGLANGSADVSAGVHLAVKLF